MANLKRKILSVVLSSALLLSIIPFYSFAEEESVVDTESTVTQSMCKSDFWEELTLGDKDEVLMSLDEIESFNKEILNASGTNMYNLLSDKYKGTYDADSIRQSLASNNPFAYRTDKESVYINDVTYNKNDYIENQVLTAIEETGYTDTEMNYQFAVGTKRCGMLALPIPYEMGWSSTDQDDENQTAVIDVNEPVIIKQKAEFEGHTFYNVISDNCSGWVDAENLAVCKTRDEWLDAWQVDYSSKDFLVVTQDKIVLEKSHMNKATSEVKLTLGTILKLVPEDEIPSVIDGERGTWNNYVVYIPTRDENGFYVKQAALISQHYDVSVGFAKCTQENFLKIAFSCLGNRYGWGGCDDAMDCTLYTRLIYKCMGINLPRNTTWQMCVPGIINMSSMSEEDKETLLETSPAGSLVYWSGHAVMYVGTSNNTNYAISNTGTLSDSTGDLKVTTQYSTILNPLTVRRGTGYTWLYTQTHVFIPGGAMDISSSKVTQKNGTITLTYKGKELYENVNYTVNEENGTYTITGINNFEGEITYTTSAIEKIELSKASYYYNGKTHCPYVTAYSNGKTYKTANSNLNVTRDTGKLPGTYKVTVEGINKLTGTKSKTFKVVIKPASIKETAKTSASIKVTADKLSSTYVTGYQVKYSTNSSMKSSKTKASKSNTINLTNLKSGTKYYLKIRSYKTINGKKYYSSWSNTKSVKTK